MDGLLGVAGMIMVDLWIKHVTRPGKRLHFANLKMAIEIVDLPMNSMVDLSSLLC